MRITPKARARLAGAGFYGVHSYQVFDAVNYLKEAEVLLRDPYRTLYKIPGDDYDALKTTFREMSYTYVFINCFRAGGCSCPVIDGIFPSRGADFFVLGWADRLISLEIFRDFFPLFATDRRSIQHEKCLGEALRNYYRTTFDSDELFLPGVGLGPRPGHE